MHRSLDYYRRAVIVAYTTTEKAKVHMFLGKAFY